MQDSHQEWAIEALPEEQRQFMARAVLAGWTFRYTPRVRLGAWNAYVGTNPPPLYSRSTLRLLIDEMRLDAGAH